MTPINSVPVQGTLLAFKSRAANNFLLNNARKITPFALETIEKFKLLELKEQELKDKISATIIARFPELAEQPYAELKECLEAYILEDTQH